MCMTGPKHLTREFEDVAIDSTGEIVETSIRESLTVSVNIVGDSTADYALDVSADGDTWFENEETYSGADIRDTFDITDRHMRIRVTNTASNGDTADITIQGVR